MKKFINLIIFVIVVFCIYKIGVKGYQYFKDENTYAELNNLKPTISKVTNDEVINDEYTTKEQELLSINKDYKMWIFVPNTNIDYPIVKGSDNEFYTTHNFNKEESISGCLFIDSNNNVDIDKNIVIYGHHMKNETMFHNLNYFKEEEFFYENKINIIKNGEMHEYRPFSVYVIPEDEAVFNMSFTDNNNDYKMYLESLKSKSYFLSNINLDEERDIVTLITCSYEYDGARTVVHAIREN